MAVKTMNHNGKLHSAMDLLNQIAREKKEALVDNFDHVKKMTTDAIEEGEGKVKKTALKIKRDVKKVIHKNPWKAIGAFAAGALALGYFLGKKK